MAGSSSAPPEKHASLEVVVTNGAGQEVWYTSDLVAWLTTKIETGYLRKFNSPADVLVADFLLHSRLKPVGKPLCSLCLCPIENDDGEGGDLQFAYSEPILGRVMRLAAAGGDNGVDAEGDLCRTTVRLLLGERLVRFEFKDPPDTVEVMKDPRGDSRFDSPPFQKWPTTAQEIEAQELFETPIMMCRPSWFFVDCATAPSVIRVQLWAQLFKPLCQLVGPLAQERCGGFRMARIVDQEVTMDDKTVLRKQVAVEIPNLWTQDELWHLVLAWLRTHADAGPDLDRLLGTIRDAGPSASLWVFKPQTHPKTLLLGMLDILSWCVEGTVSGVGFVGAAAGVVFVRKLHAIETSVVYDHARHDQAELRLGRRTHLSLAELLWVQAVEEFGTDLDFLLRMEFTDPYPIRHMKTKYFAREIRTAFCDAIGVDL